MAAARKLNVKVPIVLRLEGTNVEEGRQILKESGLNFQMGANMKEAAELVVKAAAKRKRSRITDLFWRDHGGTRR